MNKNNSITFLGLQIVHNLTIIVINLMHKRIEGQSDRLAFNLDLTKGEGDRHAIQYDLAGK